MNVNSTAYNDTKGIILMHNGAGRADILEALVDLHGLSVVLSELAAVCEVKAEHIRYNWQDDRLADQWYRNGVKITKAANSVKS